MPIRRVGEILRGLGAFLEELETAPTRPTRAVYGFTVRTGAGQPLVERSGTVGSRQAGTNRDVRTPMVDVFDEGDHFRLVAELPGVGADDIRFEVCGDVVRLEAVHGERHYIKEVTLGATARTSGSTWAYRNGVFELKLPRATPASGGGN